MLKRNQDDELFGHDSDLDENFEDEVKQQDSMNPLYMESDVDENETFDDTDYFGENNTDYKQASPFPKIKCPDDKTLDNYE